MQNEVRDDVISLIKSFHSKYSIRDADENSSFFLFFFSFNSQLFGHLSHFPHDVSMVLLEDYWVQTSLPLKSGKTHHSSPKNIFPENIFSFHALRVG